METNLIGVMLEGSVKAIQHMLVSPSGEIKPNLELINTWDNEKRKCIHDALREVIKKRYPVFVEELKPLMDMPVFNNELAKQFLNAECMLIAIDTVKAVT